MSILVAGLTLVSAFLITFFVNAKFDPLFPGEKRGPTDSRRGPNLAREKGRHPDDGGLTLHLVSSTNLRLGGGLARPTEWYLRRPVVHPDRLRLNRNVGRLH